MPAFSQKTDRGNSRRLRRNQEPNFWPETNVSARHRSAVIKSLRLALIVWLS